MKSKIIILAFTILCLLTSIVKQSMRKDKLFRYDASGYHLYLPALFIYNDLGTLSFYDTLDKKYKIADVPWYSITTLPDGNRVNKYTVGVSIMEAPFFLLAHAYTILFRAGFPADGYSLPYQYGAIVSVIFWVAMGLFLLADFLGRLFTQSIACVVIICLAIGTNLLYYTIVSQGGNHTYSFFLVACLLQYTDLWYRTHKTKHIALAGLALGLITITRQVDVVVAIIPLLWRVNSITAMKERLRLFAVHWKQLAITCLVLGTVVFIQLLYWKFTSGHWFFYSYGKENFVWSEPRVWDGLFSYRKGWFVYTPIAFIAMIGFIPLYRSDKRIVPAFLLFFAIIIFITFSWWCWWYGGGYGCRPLVDFLPLLALPLAALCQYISKQRKLVKYAFHTLFSLLITLNLFQMYQFTQGILNDSWVTKAYYWRVFGRLEVTETDKELLLDSRTYWKDMGRIDRK